MHCFPRRAALEAKFEAKLAASRRFVVDGKRVRRAARGGGGGSEAEGDDEEEEDSEGRVSRSEAAKLRPSYIAWHSAPKAQRFGPFRCALTLAGVALRARGLIVL